jgi:hypothetical protein
MGILLHARSSFYSEFAQGRLSPRWCKRGALTRVVGEGGDLESRHAPREIPRLARKCKVLGMTGGGRVTPRKC